MRFDWVTFGLQIVNLGVLLAILRHFLFKPIARIVAKRQADTKAAMDAAEAARAVAEGAVASAKAEARKTESARHDLLAAALDEAAEQRKTLLAAAREEAAKIVAEAHEESARAVTQAQAETLNRARDLAETIARRAVSALPDPPTIAGFASRLTAALAALPEDRRRGLLAGDHLRLIAPRPLSPEEIETARAALGQLGIEGPPAEADPTLIAGLELRSDSGVVHNSLAHDLNRIAEALDDGDGYRA